MINDLLESHPNGLMAGNATLTSKCSEHREVHFPSWPITVQHKISLVLSALTVMTVLCCFRGLWRQRNVSRVGILE